MDIDASNDAFVYHKQKTTTSIDPVEQAVHFLPSKQLELPVNLSQRNLLEQSISDQPINDDDDDERYDFKMKAYFVHYRILIRREIVGFLWL